MSNTNLNYVIHQGFDGRGFTDSNSLAAARLTNPDTINPVITYMQGKDSDRFPLTFLTEGQKGGVRTEEIKNIEYLWDIMGKRKRAVAVVATPYGSTDKPGLNGQEIQATFKIKWFNYQHTIVHGTGARLRVKAQPTKVSNGWLYKFDYLTKDTTAYLDPTTLYVGQKWIQEGVGTVSNSLSFGNDSNIVTPGKAKNQISILRKSYHYAGNINEQYVECKFNIGGRITSKWMEYEEWEKELEWKEAVEEHLWYSEYNRDSQGIVHLKDEETGQEIPHGGGLINQIPNHDTYSFLTADKLDKTVLSVMYGRNDDKVAQTIVLYTGIGGAREFDRAIKQEVAGISQITGDKFVSGSGGNLKYGGYFSAYETKEGRQIIVKQLEILDKGSRAMVAPLHYETQLPMTSYNMYFVDQTTYDGVPNVRMVTQKGRGMIRGIEQGMTLIKGRDFGDYSGNTVALSTSQDKTSIHYLCAKGVNINRNSHCFHLEPDYTLAQ